MLAGPASSLAQAGANAAPPPNAAQGPAQNAPKAAAPQAPSAILQPPLDALQKAVSSLNLDKWKRGNVRSEAEANISSIMRDVQETLPPLMKEADGAPGAMSKTLPVSRNVDALYDVLLRVVDAARIAAPGDQVDALQQAQVDLEKARRTLDQQLQDAAAAQEKQVSSLQVALKEKSAIPPPVVAPPPPPAPCAPVRKARPKKKTTPPATTQPSGSQPSAAQKPQS